MPDFIEVSVSCDVDAGELIALLPDCDGLGCWEKDGSVCLYWPEEKWNPETLVDLRACLLRMGIADRPGLIAVHEMPDQDWNAVWASSLTPIRVGCRIRIRQSWCAADPGFGGIELVIDPKRAFGSGYHATTQLVLEWLENNVRGGERVLDVGTGSGILAMAAVRLGAAVAIGVDNDPAAVECAREYAEVNGFGPELQLSVASFEDFDLDGFDLVLANLDIRTLPALCRELPKRLKPGGVACLSGVMEQDVQEVSEALTQIGMHVVGRRRREEWYSLEAR